MEKIEIAVIVRPQGIKGELKLKPFVDSFDSIKKLKTIYIDNEEYKIKHLKNAGDSFILSIDGLFDRNSAELFRNKTVFADKELIKKDKDSYFIVDIIGCVVKLDTGKTIGKVEDITSSNVDIYKVVNNENKTCYFPFLKDLIDDIDIENKTIVLRETKFVEVCLYED